ncbi:MAG TPA: DNA polymerase IV [Myxococcaceae bacterium]|nr:DNA polymerase IV [Myxococcaceae bacterium]
MDSPRAILHLDMDAFYASVEQRDDPRLRGRPVIVGGHPRRGVVLAASYEVRPSGVRSAMPMARALKLAPQAVVVPPRFEAYAQASEQVFGIFERYTPLVEPLSLDEAFLDVTGSRSLFGPPAGVATRIRADIARELSLPCSAGIAAVKFVAKIASDLAKPDGQRQVRAEETRAFLAALPVARLWGVGPKLEADLRTLGLHTVGDVARADAGLLADRFGDAGRHLVQLARGQDERPVVPDRQAKSIGAEDTFEEDTESDDVLRRALHAQALRVGRRLRRAGLRARTVQLKLKLADFTLLTRRRTLEAATDDGQRLYREAAELLGRTPLPQPVRLTGVSAQELCEGDSQLRLFERDVRADRLNAALDAIAARFGQGAVGPADIAPLETAEGPDDEARRRAGAARFDVDR